MPSRLHPANNTVASNTAKAPRRGSKFTDSFLMSTMGNSDDNNVWFITLAMAKSQPGLRGERKQHQKPSSKHQRSSKLQVPSSKFEARAAVWSLELGISLVFGAWCLVFRFRDFSRGWCLGFGVSFSHCWPRAHP